MFQWYLGFSLISLQYEMKVEVSTSATFLRIWINETSHNWFIEFQETASVRYLLRLWISFLYYLFTVCTARQCRSFHWMVQTNQLLATDNKTCTYLCKRKETVHQYRMVCCYSQQKKRLDDDSIFNQWWLHRLNDKDGISFWSSACFGWEMCRIFHERCVC